MNILTSVVIECCRYVFCRTIADRVAGQKGGLPDRPVTDEDTFDGGYIFHGRPGVLIHRRGYSPVAGRH